VEVVDQTLDDLTQPVRVLVPRLGSEAQFSVDRAAFPESLEAEIKPSACFIARVSLNRRAGAQMLFRDFELAPEPLRDDQLA
jgi:hypothetical protein